VPSPWAIVGQRDFNGDGMSDILLHNGASGDVQIWALNGATLLPPPASGSLGPGPVGFEIVGTGDFNGDCRGDILWHNPMTGELLIWFGNGTLVPTSVPLGLSAPAPWTVIGIGDFNGDGMSDILWRYGTSGDVQIWALNGANLLPPPATGSLGPGPAGFEIVGTGDFNGDGISDILWFDGRQAMIWLLNPTLVPTPWSLGSMDPRFRWGIGSTGDFNGDGKSDVMWTSNLAFGLGETGIELWFLDGVVIGRGSPGTMDRHFQIQFKNAD
jgi:FG-GAP-like repeat